MTPVVLSLSALLLGLLLAFNMHPDQPSLTVLPFEPIETAPKDFRGDLLLAVPYADPRRPTLWVFVQGARVGNLWISTESGQPCHPTHWSYLPAAPKV